MHRIELRRIPGVDELKVPCGKCHACCVSDMIVVSESLGDNTSLYHLERVGGLHILAHKPNGECRYLTAEGCSIHTFRPYKCRIFDCRVLVGMYSGKKLKAMVKSGVLSKHVVRSGKRLRT